MFRKCGEIMLAVQSEQIVMRCNFCHQMFAQLQALMRHLHYEHNDEVGFVKPAEVEVYAIEELIDKSSLNTCSPDIGNDEDETDWLNEEDLQWLNEGVVINNKPTGKEENEIAGNDNKYASNITGDEEDEINATNMSILKDCGISFNGVDKFNTNCFKEEDVSNFEKTFWQTIQIDWEDCETSESTAKSVEDVEKFKHNEILLHTSTKLETVTSMTVTKLVTNKSFVEQNLTQTEENNKQSTKSFNRLWHSLEDFDDVDNLLDSLENYADTGEFNKIKESIIDNENILFAETQNRSCQDDKSLNNIFPIQSKNSIDTGSNCLENFEACLQELEIALDEDILNSNIESKAKQMIKTDNKELNIEQKCKKLNESSLTTDNNDDENKKAFSTDIDKELTNLNEQDIVKEKSNLLKNKPLNEDLTKALLDALDGENIDLINLHLKEEDEELLNKEVLDVLEHEILEKDVEKEMYVQQIPDVKTSSNNVVIKDTNVETLKAKCETINNNTLAKTSKYQKTNLTARKRPLQQLNVTNPSVLKQKPFLKGNKGIILNHQLHHNANSVKSPAKTFTLEKTNQIRQNQTRNKENLVLKIQKIPKQKPIPNTSFINKERGCKLPVKREDMFLKPLPKVQKPSILQNITTKNQEKQKILYIQQTPLTERQQITQFRNKEEPKQSLKSQYKRNKLLQNDKITLNYNSVTETEKNKIRRITASNEKPSTCAKSVGDVSHLLNEYKDDNVAIGKWPNTVKIHKIKPSDIDAKQIDERIKLPKQLTLTAEASNHKQLELTAEASTYNQCEMISTPIKASTYCKQNFFESSVQNIQLENTKEPNFNKEQHRASTTLHQRMTSIDMVKTNVKTAKQDIANIRNKTPRHSILNYKSYAVNRSSRKKEVFQRMSNIKKQIFKSLEESESLVKFKTKQSPLIKHQKRRNVIIEQVKILPSLHQTTLTPFILPEYKKPSPNNSANSTEILPLTKSLVGEQNSTNNKADKRFELATKRQATSTPTLLEETNYAKHQHISADYKQHEENIVTELEHTQLDLSESCVDFLQRNLKASRLNVESLLNSEMSEDEPPSDEAATESNNNAASLQETFKDDTSLIINDLLEQVANETPTEVVAQAENTSEDKNNTPTISHVIEDFDEAKDIDLLHKIGLKIIKLPEIEDAVLLEERDEMNEKARQFATIYKNFKSIWLPKTNEYLTYKKDLDKHFKSLMAETNTHFNLKLNMIEIKRLVNLINIWFAQNVCTRFIEKRQISDSTNRYLSYFLYIPKTIKRFYYCEYCEEYANTEHKYYTHRITHTGALYPYECTKCSAGFKLLKNLKGHESACRKVDKAIMLRVRKCLVCEKIFKTDEHLYEHSKTHLKNIYRCTKCDKVFASVKDVKIHLNVCNTANKCMQQNLLKAQTK